MLWPKVLLSLILGGSAQFFVFQNLKIPALFILGGFITLGYLEWREKRWPAVLLLSLCFLWGSALYKAEWRGWQNNLQKIRAGSAFERTIKVFETKNRYFLGKDILYGESFVFFKKKGLEEIKPGDVLWIKGQANILPTIGKYSWAKDMFSRGTKAGVKVQEFKKISYIPDLKVYLQRIREKIEQRMFVLFGKEGGIFIGLFSGNEEYISKNEIEILNTTGTRHLSAVSGGNLVILGAGLLWFLSLLFSPKTARFLVFVVLSLYVFSLPFQYSAQRAWFFALLLLFSFFTARQVSLGYLLLLSLSIFYIYSPFTLFWSPSFQFSFLALLGINMLAKPLERIATKLKSARVFKEYLILTVSAQFFTLPLSWWYFKQVNLLSPLANLVFSPFVPLFTIAPLTLALLSFALPLQSGTPFIQVLLYIKKSIFWLLNKMVVFSQLIPLTLHVVFILLIYGVLLFIVFRQELEKEEGSLLEPLGLRRFSAKL